MVEPTNAVVTSAARFEIDRIMKESPAPLAEATTSERLLVCAVLNYLKIGFDWTCENPGPEAPNRFELCKDWRLILN